MKPLAALLTLILSFAACGGGSVTGTSPSVSPSTGSTGITFDGLSGMPCTGLNPAPSPACALPTYSEGGFTVTTSGAWNVRTDYGHPAPFVQFWTAAGTVDSGTIQVTRAGSVFYFTSIDLYSSTTPIPYTLKGTRNGSVVFTISDTLPNTFGNFRTVLNPNATQAIDSLSIGLTNASAACCQNPMGLDTIVVSSSPVAAQPMFSLSGRVLDAATGTGIPNAIVSVADGPNMGLAAFADSSGTFSFGKLVQSGFTVTAVASGYVSQSKGVTLTSDQSVLFQLNRQASNPPPTPPPAGATVVGFGGLTTNGAAFTTLSESGFTISNVSGAWTASTTYGSPAPFIQFVAPAGSTVTGEIRVTAGGSPFSFYSVDLYSSTTQIPYTITGHRNSSQVFTTTGTIPNTFGAFKTLVVANDAPIDTLSIVLTNPAVGTANPTGLDNIVLKR